MTTLLRMILKHLTLQHFRNYSKATFNFSENITAIVGPNTAGKTNLIESIMLLVSGKSYLLEKDVFLTQSGKQVGRVKGTAVSEEEKKQLEVVIPSDIGNDDGQTTPPKMMKRYLVNGVAKRRVDFVGILKAVLFVPTDLDIVIAGPSHRRAFLDTVLEQTDREYRVALSSYAKALRQRNALLELARETGRRKTEQFEYWDSLLIGYGETISEKRTELIDYVNEQKKSLLSFSLSYDQSVLSKERLLQYKDAEVASGVTLVGPHRDELLLFIGKNKEAKVFASRGQQRLLVLELKLLELSFIEEKSGERPMLLLDDIFSELDQEHIDLVLETIKRQQTILTTTHEEFLNGSGISKSDMVELVK